MLGSVRGSNLRDCVSRLGQMLGSMLGLHVRVNVRAIC